MRDCSHSDCIGYLFSSDNRDPTTPRSPDSSLKKKKQNSQNIPASKGCDGSLTFPFEHRALTKLLKINFHEKFRYV